METPPNVRLEYLELPGGLELSPFDLINPNNKLSMPSSFQSNKSDRSRIDLDATVTHAASSDRVTSNIPSSQSPASETQNAQPQTDEAQDSNSELTHISNGKPRLHACPGPGEELDSLESDNELSASDDPLVQDNDRTVISDRLAGAPGEQYHHEDAGKTYVRGANEPNQFVDSAANGSSSISKKATDVDRTKTAAKSDNGRADSVGSKSQPRAVYRLGWHAAAESLIGLELDHFRIESLVGIGGMGAVFRGEDTRLNREVAIKAIPLAGRDPESMRRFRFEAQSAAKLDHPNIARVYYVGETADWSYIVFEFVEGVNLREIVMRQGPMSLEQSVYLVRQVSQALQHASERQVVHRDIKPSNIVLTASGQAKIVDMGLARVIEMDRSTNDLTASGVTLGTFDYISPEQAHDPRDADVRSDIYSLGCTWYYLLTGYPPFPDGTALQKLLLHGTKMPEDPRRFRTDLSDSVIAILRKMIAKKPSDRYQQPLDLIDDLQTLAVLEDLSWTRDTDPREATSPVGTSIWRKAMPYIVSLASIGIVSGVLYTEGRRTNHFVIPEVLFPETPQDQSRVGAVAKVQEEPGILSVPGEANSVLVDSRFSNEQLETNRQLASSLDQAIERINLSSEANRIVLQSSVFRSTSSLRTINRTEGRLTIESQAGTRSRLEIQISDDYLSDNRTWIDCGTNAITIVGCDIVWKTSNPRQSLFALRNLSQLRLEDCTVSVEPTGSSSPSGLLPTIFRCEAPLELNPNQSVPSAIASTVQIAMDRVVVIGQADLLQISPPVRTECKISNSLFAISGSVLQLPRVNGAVMGNSRVVLDMQSVTVWANRSFIHASWISGDSAPIPVTRTAKRCVFSGMESLVYWDVAINEEWKFWEQTKRGESLTQWLDFRGEDNSYDEEITKQLVEAKLRNGMAESVPLSAEAVLLSAERGIELTIPWRNKPSLESATRLPMNLSLFELQRSSFPRGADILTLVNSQATRTDSLEGSTLGPSNGASPTNPTIPPTVNSASGSSVSGPMNQLGPTAAGASTPNTGSNSSPSIKSPPFSDSAVLPTSPQR